MRRDVPVAVIDIGSNSVRLVVYEKLARSPTPLFNEKMLAGLGAGVAQTGKLAPDAVAKTFRSLKRFAALARQMGVGETRVLATAAAREAENGAAFIAEVEAITGVRATLLSGEEEARMAALGVVSGFDAPDGVVGDLGGGSLELIDVRGRDIGVGDSLLLGGLRLQSASKGSLKEARELARKAIESSTAIRGLPGRTFYAVGGTWRSLGRMHMHERGYPFHVMHEYRIDAEELEEFLKVLMRPTLEAVPGIEVVSKQRQALLPFGATVLNEVLRVGRPKRVAISALGLREGLLYSELTPAEQLEDPLISAARELSRLRSRSPEHAEELIDWTAGAMAALGIEETATDRRLRTAACLLSDIGWRAHPDYRGEQSLNIIAHAAFVGVDHPGRAYLALAVYYRHSGLSESELGGGIRDLAPTRYRENARALAASFRVAYILSGAMRGTLPRTKLRRSNFELQLALPADLADLHAPRLDSRLKQLAALAGLAPQVTIER